MQQFSLVLVSAVLLHVRKLMPRTRTRVNVAEYLFKGGYYHNTRKITIPIKAANKPKRLQAWHLTGHQGEGL